MATKGYCDVCGIDIEIQICCNGHECGCMGLPIDPPVCSEECYNTYFSEERIKERRNAVNSFIITKNTDKKS